MDQFNDYDAEAFEKWLCAQFTKLYRGSDKERYHAFDLRDLGISRGESHLDALHHLFRKLSDDGKSRFQAALERILRNAKQDELAGEAMADVVKLIGLTRFRHAFQAFVAIFGCGAWGENRPSLIYDALSVLMMFEGSDDVYETTKALATSRNFPDNLVFDAFLILARSRPENWREDFLLLRDRFERVRRNVEAIDNENLLAQLNSRWRSLARSLAQLPLSDLAAGLATFAESAEPHVGPSAVKSLLANIVFDKDAPLRPAWDAEADHMVIVDCAQPARKEILRTSAAIVVLTINRGGILGSESGFDSLDKGVTTSAVPGFQARLNNILGPRTRSDRAVAIRNHV